jgi:hypothetical protein
MAGNKNINLRRMQQALIMIDIITGTGSGLIPEQKLES